MSRLWVSWWLLAAVTLFAACSLLQVDPAFVDNVTAELVKSGLSPEASKAIATMIGDKMGGLPTWLQVSINALTFALFPTLAAMRNRSRVTAFDGLKSEILAEVVKVAPKP